MEHHKITDKNFEQGYGTCSVCGPKTKIVSGGTNKGWSCAERKNSVRRRNDDDERILIARKDIDQQLPDDIYFAGFLDADGCFAIDMNGPYITASQVKIEILNLLLERFGGNMQGPFYSSENARPVYRWTVKSKGALRAISALIPYLFIKREQAVLALEYFELTIGNNRIQGRHFDKEKNKAILEKRHAIFQKVAKLNKRGTNNKNFRPGEGATPNVIAPEASPNASVSMFAPPPEVGQSF